MSLYKPEEYADWVSLDDHLDYHNDSFPVDVVSNFLVVFSPPEGYEDKYPWKGGDPILFLGEIPGMKGHGIFAGTDGLAKWGYHTVNFRVIPEDML